jgi:alpha-1,3-rhamnosyl/mannosyltransferase
MKVAFNATSLLSPLTGIGQYSWQLAAGLAGRVDVDPVFFYGTHWSRRVRPSPVAGARQLMPFLRDSLPFSYELRRMVQSDRFSRARKPATIDLYHEPNILPFPFDGPTLITVHDLSWIRHPEAHPKKRVQAMNKYFPTGLARASRVITDSGFVKRELMTIFSVPEEKISVVPLGVESEFRPMNEVQTHGTLQSLGLTHGRFFLVVGTMEPRKNLKAAVEAYVRLPVSIRMRFPLVLAGMKGWDTDALSQKLSTMNRRGEVRLLGYLPRTTLAFVVASATGLIFPSIYEGFGLPVLEAMACGIPVISSNAASMPEVAGEAGILLDPHDTDGITWAMEHLATSAEERRRLGLLGLERSKSFTWEACVNSTVDVYRQTLGKSSKAQPTSIEPKLAQ